MEHLIGHYIAMLYGGSYSMQPSPIPPHYWLLHAYIIYTYSKIQPIKHVQI